MVERGYEDYVAKMLGITVMEWRALSKRKYNVLLNDAFPNTWKNNKKREEMVQMYSDQ